MTKKMKTIFGEFVEVTSVGAVTSTFYKNESEIYRDEAGKLYYNIDRAVLAECESETPEDAVTELREFLDDLEREIIEGIIDDWIDAHSPDYDEMNVDYDTLGVNDEDEIICEAENNGERYRFKIVEYDVEVEKI
ncbi:hypothetical protein SAMN06296386_10911 [Lachnospiraceae bacterium]|nr:hypothetical protein SAMN06296386_10911 [Lachnospiraceae bacterium]